MSSMTLGEYGTRTKHRTKDSLRKEVISLISRATNDIFEFCKDLDLSAIHVGCRHYVKTTSPYGTTRDENMILYKISIQKNRIPRVASNPFLDVYSTTKYFEVAEDNFADIEIEKLSSAAAASERIGAESVARLFEHPAVLSSKRHRRSESNSRRARLKREEAQ